jgi:hypothetical protein
LAKVSRRHQRLASKPKGGSGGQPPKRTSGSRPTPKLTLYALVRTYRGGTGIIAEVSTTTSELARFLFSQKIRPSLQDYVIPVHGQHTTIGQVRLLKTRIPPAYRE